MMFCALVFAAAMLTGLLAEEPKSLRRKEMMGDYMMVIVVGVVVLSLSLSLKLFDWRYEGGVLIQLWQSTIQ